MKTIKGKILSFNFSPKGTHESLLLENGEGIVQINFPREATPDVSHELRQGQEFTATVQTMEDHRPSHHPVYEWLQDKPEPREGIIRQINYARHGEPNGAILETGEFLHLRPEGAKAASLQIGQKLSFEGDSRNAPGGFIVIEARTVNGLALDQLKKPKPNKQK